MNDKSQASCCETKEAANPDHTKQVARINRIIGQLEGVKKMLEEKRYCPEILMQTRAVSSAVKALESQILEKHLSHCVVDAFSARNQSEAEIKIIELLEIFKAGK